MRFDIITIFPSYFDALDVSLVGKARESGRLTINTHDLRDWAEGRHRAVDDKPFGGGAGMVMMPTVWGLAIDATLDAGAYPAGGRAVLAIPTPSGVPLTQRKVEDLALADQIIVACGRYEGIDSRVANHYRDAGVEVFEYSLGDYVLNGGEVAAAALVEAVSRLVEGVIGNPESLVEESHSEAGLLEYPAYTNPRVWRGLEVPRVLLGGHHANIARWRRDRALMKTSDMRPDMIANLAKRADLDRADREALAKKGVVLTPQPARVTYSAAKREDLPEIADLAGRVFPLACPPGLPREEINEFIEQNLSVAELTRLVDEEDGRVSYVATVDEDGMRGEIIAYSLVFPTLPDDIPPATDHTVYLSKLYVDQAWHGSGIAAALLDFAIDDARKAWGADCVMLGTNRANKRAIRFYRQHGFTRKGSRIFVVGPREHHDNVYVRHLTED